MFSESEIRPPSVFVTSKLHIITLPIPRFYSGILKRFLTTTLVTPTDKWEQKATPISFATQFHVIAVHPAMSRYATINQY